MQLVSVQMCNKNGSYLTLSSDGDPSDCSRVVYVVLQHRVAESKYHPLPDLLYFMNFKSF